VVAVVFQNDFYLEMHQNNFFLKLFLTSAHQNNLKIPKKINLKQIKNFQFFSKVFLKCQNKRGIFPLNVILKETTPTITSVLEFGIILVNIFARKI